MKLREIDLLVLKYRNAQKDLNEYRKRKLPSGAFVLVNSKSYKGEGQVMPSSRDCPSDRIPILLGNENIWWYPIEDVEIKGKI